MIPKLFLLEIDPDIRFVLDIYLSRQGYEIFSFSLIEPLVQALQTTIPDAILLDYYTLKIYGSELLSKKLKADYLYPHKIFLLSTSDIRPLVMKESLADVFISKPFDLVEVADLISVALQ